MGSVRQAGVGVGLFLMFGLSLSACKARIESQTEAIYGEDNRTVPYLHKDPTLRRMADVAVVLTRKKGWPILKAGHCSGAVFSHGSRQVLITAGHCIKSQSACDSTYLAYHFEDAPGLKPEDQVIRKCEKLLFHKTDYPDLAIATISGPIYGKYHSDRVYSLPLKFSKSGEGAKIAVIGHPSGKKKKITDQCQIEEYSGFLFYHRCDTFSGNSGSPIFDVSDYSLIGVVEGGRKDMTPDGKERRYKLGSENGTDVVTHQDQIKQIITGGRVALGGFVARDGQDVSPTWSRFPIRCAADVPAPDCEKTRKLLVKTIDDKFADQRDLDHLGVIQVSLASESVEIDEIRLPFTATEEKIKATLDAYLKEFESELTRKKLAKRVRGINLRCGDEIENDRCSKAIEAMRRLLKEGGAKPAKSYDVGVMFAEEKWEIEYPSYVDFGIEGETFEASGYEAWKSRALKMLQRRAELIARQRQDRIAKGSHINGIDIKPSQNLAEGTDLTLLKSHLKAIFAANPDYDEFSLDANTISVGYQNDFSRPYTIWVHHNASLEELQPLFKHRYVKQ